MTSEKLKQVAKEVDDLISAAWSLSAAAQGKYKDRPIFKWDLPEIEALKKMRSALKALGVPDVGRHETNGAP